MTAEIEWTESAFRASTTGQAWSYTEYDRGWETCRDAAELRVIFEEEMALESVPDWAVEIVERMLASPLPACGHYSFPRPILQVCEAIAQEQCPDLVVGCYTADPERKSLMSRYVFCLDAWLEQAPVETAQAELGLRADRDRDWDRIVEAIYATLGERTEERILLVRRLAHRLRWWLKTLIWDDDRRDRFGPDLYLGDARGSAEWGNYGNPGFDDPYFAELEAPEVRALSEAIRSRVTDGGALLEQIESTWLCAPKAFRYLERLITAIGSVGAAASPDSARPLLQCDETYPDFAASRTWHARFVSSLDAWLNGEPAALPALGPVTPVKHWLARMLHHRLEVYRGFTQYLGGDPAGRSGTGGIQAS